MKITMKYFASLREALGRSEETLEVPGGTDVERLRGLLVERHPALRDLMGSTLAIVNMAYVTGERLLEDKDEVAFIPPVSGG
jgi:molybdopterin synthase sulfur carrier subunit